MAYRVSTTKTREPTSDQVDLLQAWAEVKVGSGPKLVAQAARDFWEGRDLNDLAELAHAKFADGTPFGITKLCRMPVDDILSALVDANHFGDQLLDFIPYPNRAKSKGELNTMCKYHFVGLFRFLGFKLIQLDTEGTYFHLSDYDNRPELWMESLADTTYMAIWADVKHGVKTSAVESWSRIDGPNNPVLHLVPKAKAKVAKVAKAKVAPFDKLLAAADMAELQSMAAKIMTRQAELQAFDVLIEPEVLVAEIIDDLIGATVERAGEGRVVQAVEAIEANEVAETRIVDGVTMYQSASEAGKTSWAFEGAKRGFSDNAIEKRVGSFVRALDNAKKLAEFGSLEIVW